MTFKEHTAHNDVILTKIKNPLKEEMVLCFTEQEDVSLYKAELGVFTESFQWTNKQRCFCLGNKCSHNIPILQATAE